MKKTIISAFVIFSTSLYASNYNVIIKKEQNFVTEQKGVSYTEWAFVYNECNNDIEVDELYYNETAVQNSVCQDNYIRTKTTTTTDEFGNVVIKDEEEKKNEITSNESNLITGTHIENSCQLILNNGYSNGDGIYFVSVNSTPVEVACYMTIDGGGWTLVTRLNTTDENVRKHNNSFWTTELEVGNLSNGKDYSSIYKKSTENFSDVLFEFNYNKGRLISSFINNSNTLNFYESLNQSISNNNLDFVKGYTNNSDSNDFFGDILSFQVNGETPGGYPDYFRLWYNKTSKDHCNQTGGIGTESDIGNAQNWWTEAGHPSDYNDCQENFLRSYLGTNHGGTHSVITNPALEQIISDPDYYTTNLINIYIR